MFIFYTSDKFTPQKSFQNMLSKDMNYSSAIFLDYKEDLVKVPELCETLESAQLRKMR